jgi:TfoX/Sxy family transcriptional regulator of competence genes
MAKTSSLRPSFHSSPADLIALFEKVMATLPNAEMRKVFGYPAAFVNGQMFGGLHNDSMILNLPPEDLIIFLALEGAHPFEPMPGRPMRGYAVVPPSLLKSETELVVWFGKAFEYVGSLPPKPPKKPKKKT